MKLNIYAPYGLGRAIEAANRTARKRSRIEAFAEALAEHGTIAKACTASGISYKTGERYLAEIKRGLGPQAR